MSLAFVAPGTPMRIGPSQYALWRPLRSSTATTEDSAGPHLSDISGLSGWWDAGTVSDLLDQTGLPIPDWNSPVGSLLDKSGSRAQCCRFGLALQENYLLPRQDYRDSWEVSGWLQAAQTRSRRLSIPILGSRFKTSPSMHQENGPSILSGLDRTGAKTQTAIPALSHCYVPATLLSCKRAHQEMVASAYSLIQKE